MPLLCAEPMQYPSELLESEAARTYGDRRWYVMHTRPRQEKCLTRSLRSLEIPYYLPLISRRHRYRNRVLTGYLPLFPGYVPIWADATEQLTAFRTRYIVQSLEVGDQERFFRDLCQIRRLIDAGVPITPESRLMPGDHVEICSGPLRGMQGVVWRSNQQQRRFAIQVNFLQCGASIIAEDFELKRI